MRFFKTRTCYPVLALLLLISGCAIFDNSAKIESFIGKETWEAGTYEDFTKGPPGLVIKDVSLFMGGRGRF